MKIFNAKKVANEGKKAFLNADLPIEQRIPRGFSSASSAF